VAISLGFIVMKRVLDFFVSLVIMILLTPLICLVSLAIFIKMGSPVIFVQRRPGLHGIPFVMYKFRTMTNEKDANGNLLPNEQRLNSLGKFLRSTSLDELPELVNVLKGEMSLVGPRPLLMEYLDLYSNFEARRHEVKPGLTGYAQVNGRNDVSWAKRFDMDVWYVDNQSLKLDISILAKTVLKVIKREGISQPGSSTIKRFEGHKRD
jgi:lipopolysaccharide/colanic/teichoic acid biosynthesis glycosyltransferase